MTGYGPDRSELKWTGISPQFAFDLLGKAVALPAADRNVSGAQERDLIHLAQAGLVLGGPSGARHAALYHVPLIRTHGLCIGQERRCSWVHRSCSVGHGISARPSRAVRAPSDTRPTSVEREQGGSLISLPRNSLVGPG